MSASVIVRRYFKIYIHVHVYLNCSVGVNIKAICDCMSNCCDASSDCVSNCCDAAMLCSDRRPLVVFTEGNAIVR